MFEALDTTVAQVTARQDALLDVLDPTPTHLAIGIDELEEVLTALEDRLETIPADRRPALERGRNALEREAARLLSRA